jgi:hypothetical protein
MATNTNTHTETIMTMFSSFMTTAEYVESVDELETSAWQELTTQINTALNKMISELRTSPRDKKLKDPNAPKRNHSAYQIFADDVRERVTKDLQAEMDKKNKADENGNKPKVSLGEVSKKIAELWNALKEEANENPKSKEARRYKT